MERTSQLKYAAVAHHSTPAIDNVAPLDDYLQSLKRWGQPGPTRKVLYLKVVDGVAHVSTQKGITPRATATAAASAMTDFLYALGLQFTSEGSPALRAAGRALCDLAHNPDEHGGVADTEALRACVHRLRVAIDEARPEPLDDQAVSLQSSSREASPQAVFPSAPSQEALIGAPATDIPLPRPHSLLNLNLSAVRTHQAGYRPLDAARPSTDRSDLASRFFKTTRLPSEEKKHLINSNED